MKVLVAGIIGATVSAAIWLGTEHILQGRDVGWLSVFVGLVTGYSVHRAAGANAGGGYLRGAVAVILSLAAIVGGRFAYAEYMQVTSQSNVIEAHIDPAGQQPQPQDADDAGADGDMGAPADARRIPTTGLLGNASRRQFSLKRSFSELDMLWMCVAALLAYLVGKGREPVVAPMGSQAKPEESAVPPGESKSQPEKTS